MNASSSQASDFAIGFDPRDRERLHRLWDQVLDSQRWTEGEMLERFEAAWEAWNGLPSVGFSGWAGAAMAVLEFAGVSGETVLCPSNTFMATPFSILKAGARVEFVDCNREDLCVSAADFVAKAEQHKPKAAWLVHIGGHLAFDVERDRRLLRRRGDLPHRGLRPCPRRELERSQAGDVGRRRGVLHVRDEDDLDR